MRSGLFHHYINWLQLQSTGYDVVPDLVSSSSVSSSVCSTSLMKVGLPSWSVVSAAESGPVSARSSNSVSRSSCFLPSDP